MCKISPCNRSQNIENSGKNSFNDNNNYENSFNEMSILIILIKEVKMMILQMIYIKLFKFYFNVYNEIKKQWIKQINLIIYN